MSTLVSDTFMDCLRSLKAKYHDGVQLDGNIFEKRVLNVFAQAITGEMISAEIFQMYSDEMMADVLDDEDMAVWLEKKAEYA